MNQQLPPNSREDLEAQVTALLLGELTAEQEVSLRARMAHDRELAKWYDQLRQSLPLVAETVATPVSEISAQPAPLKLGDDRRQKLLAHFKTTRPVEFASPRRPKVPWTVALAAAAVAILFAALSIPDFVKSRNTSRLNAIINNLRLLDSSKQQWALEQRKSATDVPAASDLLPYMGRGADSGLPAPIDGETYVYGPVGVHPYAELAHSPSQLGRDSKAALTADGELIVLPGSKAMELAQAAKRVAPASPPTAGKIAIVLPRDNVTTDANQDSLSARGYNGVPVPTPPAPASVDAARPDSNVETFSSLGYANMDQSGNLVAANTDANADKRLPAIGGGFSPTGGETRSRRGGYGGSAKSVELLAEKEKGPAPEAPPISAAAPAHSGPDFRKTAKMPPVVVFSAGGLTGGTAIADGTQKKDEMTVDAVPVPEPPYVTGTYNITGTMPDLSLENAEPLPQAQSAAGSTIGVPTTPTANVRENKGEPPAANGVRANLGAIGVQGSTAPTPLSSEVHAQNEPANSEQEKQRTEALNKSPESDAPLPHRPDVPPVPQPEVQTVSYAFSTFSLNVSDVSFKLAGASLENGVMPEVSSVRSEEFINAFDYRDPEPAPGASIGFAWERAGDPFAHNRDFLRFSIKTAAQGREAGRPLNLVLLLDKSGSMERADRVEIIRQALTVLAGQLQAQDTLSVVLFARTARLLVDGAPGNQAGEIAKKLDDITPEGGTNLEEAMRLAYATALRHYLAAGENRVVLLTDGAANLGEVDPEAFKPWLEANRKQGIALDCFGVGWDGYNDTTLETLSRTGGGRYGFINTPEQAATDFAGQLAGALRVAASDVKVQVEFNPDRVVSYRQIGYAKHQLTAEQFRDNTVAAAQIGAAESGNALYTVEVNPAGDGPLCMVRVRYRDPGTSTYREHAWAVPYNGPVAALDAASPGMRLAASAGAFSELLAGSPYAGEVTFDKLLLYLNGIPAAYGVDTRPQKLEWMVRQAKSISGK